MGKGGREGQGGGRVTGKGGSWGRRVIGEGGPWGREGHGGGRVPRERQPEGLTTAQSCLPGARLSHLVSSLLASIPLGLIHCLGAYSEARSRCLSLERMLRGPQESRPLILLKPLSMVWERAGVRMPAEPMFWFPRPGFHTYASSSCVTKAATH